MGVGTCVNWNLVTTIIPLLRTLVKLCINPIDTSHDVDVQVLFNLCCNNDANVDAVKNGDESWEIRFRP